MQEQLDVSKQKHNIKDKNLEEVPELRFPDFEENLKSYKGKDLFNIIGGGSFKSEDSVENGIKWLKIANVGINEINSNNISYLPLDFLDSFKKFVLKKDDIVIALTRPILNHELKIAVINDEFNNSLLNQRVGKLDFNQNVNPKFIYYYLQLPKSIYYLENRISGSDPPNLSNKDLLNIKINIPLIKEQNKIADFISLIDKKIELLEKTLTFFIDFEKSVRYDYFKNNDVEFDKFNLGDIAVIGKGFTPSTTNPDFWSDEGYSWLSIADMNQKYLSETTKKITEEAVGNRTLIPEGTLLMSFKLTIGRLAILEKPMFTNEAIANFKWTNEDICTEYMYYYLNSINILKYGSQAAKGITLNNDTLSSIPILLPSYEEQVNIVKKLNSFNNKINLLNQKIDEFSEFKKGLLQQMFV